MESNCLMDNIVYSTKVEVENYKKDKEEKIYREATENEEKKGNIIINTILNRVNTKTLQCCQRKIGTLKEKSVSHEKIPRDFFLK